MSVRPHHKSGFVVAIDGPAGTGKSSATKRLSEKLGFVHVDTGALYRAIAYLFFQEGGLMEHLGDPTSDKRVGEIATQTRLRFERKPELNPSNRIIANDQDITPFIRTPEISMGASRVSAIAQVRDALLDLQRMMGGHGNSILEGRDIGTVIFPDADVKFFLTANIEERAKRRLAELEAMGKDAPSFEEVKNQIAARDQGDMNRAVAPLKKAPDAIALDTSTLTLDEVVEWMEKQVRGKLSL